MKLTGTLQKMRTHYADPIKYYFEVGDDFLVLNDLLGHNISLDYQHKIQCTCGKWVDRVFQMNLCWDCSQSKPEAADFIFYPELSKAHLGIEDRDLEWEKRMQLQPHLVYLANSSGLKVGVTRSSQNPTRWIDQGADSVLILAEVENRYLAGITEVALKNYVADKTPWRDMVMGLTKEVDLIEAKNTLEKYIPEEVKPYVKANNEIIDFTYPVDHFPTKVKSLNLQKNDSFTGKLIGVKGQYLLFEEGVVFNVRSHERYLVDLDLV